MSAFSGPQGKGARRRHRDVKRRDAAARDVVSDHTREGRKARDGELDTSRYAWVNSYVRRARA